jgi:hypothetical protein
MNINRITIQYIFSIYLFNIKGIDMHTVTHTDPSTQVEEKYGEHSTCACIHLFFPFLSILPLFQGKKKEHSFFKTKKRTFLFVHLSRKLVSFQENCRAQLSTRSCGEKAVQFLIQSGQHSTSKVHTTFPPKNALRFWSSIRNES